jgi:predicted nucleic acid-binding protein
LYFFDSSALSKRFHWEQGSPLVNQIFTSAGNSIFTSRLAVVELTSIAAIRVRTGTMTVEQADDSLRTVAESIGSRRYITEQLLDVDLVSAQPLLARHAREHRLRTLDALPLAPALHRRESSGMDRFVTDDKTLASVATLEGFEVLIPA